MLGHLLTASARPLSPDEVPEPLQPWVNWVLYGTETRLCPFLYHDANERRCAWPDVLVLTLEDQAGRFAQAWQVYAPGWIALPGDATHWPQDVMVNDTAARVIMRHGHPTLYLSAGAHRLSGRFIWQRLPETLAIPPATGLVALTVNGRAIPFPDIEKNGQVWLRERDTGARAPQADEDRLSLQVFRRVIDELPMEVVTRLQLDVAGTQRQVLIGPALLENFIPLRLDSPLPARLEPDGQVRLQVRAGRWAIELAARHAGALSVLPLRDLSPPWPHQEVWVFDARNHLRLVKPEGLTSIDPRQTNLPTAWQHLPAFRAQPGEALRLRVLRRGDPDPEPDQLAISRTLWLDFEGGGYTIKDDLTGTITRGWRLEASNDIELGRVTINGQPQFITRLPGQAVSGVEVRRGALQLTAESRYTGDITRLPAVGWAHDVQQASATIYLPPGWEVFSISGVDNTPPTWLQRWTLLDLFLVLIIALSVARLWNWVWGGLALLTLGLIWHAPGAPHYVWLHILVAIALLRMLPQGRFATWVRLYRNLSLLALLIITIPFMIQQVTVGLFPQLARPWQTVSVGHLARQEAPMNTLAGRKVETTEEMPAESRTRDRYGEPGAGPLHRMDRSTLLDEIDPHATIQTGPGLPQWTWQALPLRWNGPVQQRQTVDLVFLSPPVTLVLHLLRVACLAALVLCMLGVSGHSEPRPQRPVQTHLGLLLIMALLLGGLPVEALADVPDASLLQELKTRLLAPPECLPACAQIPRMRLEISAQAMHARLNIHAYETVAVPLPGHADHWFPMLISIDGTPATGLWRDDQGQLWLALTPGIHQIILEGPMPPRHTVLLPLPLRPHWVDVRAAGWRVDGIHQDGIVDPQLQLTRLAAPDQAGAQPALEPGALPPFVRVERTLRLGLEWHVQTRIVRLSPPGSAVLLEVPLLDGESVTTADLRVVDGKALINMGAEQSQVDWQSVLPKRAALELTAPDVTTWTEVWRADVGAVWHVEQMAGIPVVHHQDRGGRWLPEWRPWPGEAIQLAITRPLGVSGQSLTIDHSRLTLKPGRRATDATLSFTLRSSQGGQHTLVLPPGAQLQAVTINDSAQPVRQADRSVTLPVTPGEEQVVLDWHSDEPIRTLFTTADVDLGLASVNHTINVVLGRDRWILLTRGPRFGPAVLFWGVVLVLVVVALGLGRLSLTPWRWWHWLLLGLGLTQTSIWVGLLVVGWLLALGARARLSPDTSAYAFNLTQVGLGVLTVVALGLLAYAVQYGLLGLPEMQVAGNDSSAYNLNWYQDRAQARLPQAWVLSVPMVSYRLAMLAWALWLAFAVLKWLRWGWQCFVTHGLWRPLPRRRQVNAAQETQADTDETSPA
jgi:hypothetical protein